METHSSTENSRIVLKFGGTSVATKQNWERIEQILKSRLEDGLRPVVVHSALSGVTNKLEALTEIAPAGECGVLLEEIKSIHLNLASELNIDANGVLAELFEDLDKLIAGVQLIGEVSPRVYARVMSFGELAATRLGAEYLRSKGLAVEWIPAKELLCSVESPGMLESNRYTQALCRPEPSVAVQKRVDQVQGVALTQGFIASNPDGETVLLGRGGSDTSAAYIAAALEAARLEIWTDMPGMFSADPRSIPAARLLKRIDYMEAQEFASLGSKILHPRCIPPLREFQIPLEIKCTLNPEMEGTIISSQSSDDAPRVKGISSRRGITLVNMETLGMWQEVGFLSRAFSCFNELGLSIDLVSTSESSVTVSLDHSVQDINQRLLAQLSDMLSKFCRVSLIQNCAAVSLVGRRIRTILHEIAPSLEVFKEHKIHLISQAASDLNLTFVVDQDQAERLVEELHHNLIRPRQGTEKVFGESWEMLKSDRIKPQSFKEVWWSKKREQLISIAEEHGSAFIYDLEKISGQAAKLKGLNSVDRVHYAVKANNNVEVLKTIEAAGLNFECVSREEVLHLRSIFPALDSERILFTPNFAPRDEYQFAIEQGIWLTLDNLYPLQNWGELFKGQKVIVRIDPGVGRGAHEHVRTAGNFSKFGIPLFEMDQLTELGNSLDLEIVGLHAHVGSHVPTPDSWIEVAKTLAELTARFSSVRLIDIGGGFSVPETSSSPEFNLAELDAGLAIIKKTIPEVELWVEPGRYVVSEAGVLLATVTQTKGKAGQRYVGVSTGMNSLIRPALYGAFHEIVNLSRLDQRSDTVVTVVGPNCESGDKLGVDRLLPECQEGDILLIGNAGAYGRVMSSYYNMRSPAEEFVIHG